MLVVWHHPGLGDHLICNGLVNYLADQHDRIFLPCKPQYLDTVRCLYAEQPKVEPFAVARWPDDVEDAARKHGCDILRVGHERTNPNRFDASFYRQLNIPFEVRYTRFALPQRIPHEEELFECLAPGGDYCLVHAECSSGVYTLDIPGALPRVRIERSTDPFGNLLAYRMLMTKAAEIHCINSSAIHLVDGVPTRARLFYHA